MDAGKDLEALEEEMEKDSAEPADSLSTHDPGPQEPDLIPNPVPQTTEQRFFWLCSGGVWDSSSGKAKWREFKEEMGWTEDDAEAFYKANEDNQPEPWAAFIERGRDESQVDLPDLI